MHYLLSSLIGIVIGLLVAYCLLFIGVLKLLVMRTNGMLILAWILFSIGISGKIGYEVYNFLYLQN